MQYWIVLLLGLINFSANAQDQQYVWANNGLVMRDAPSKQAGKLKTLPYGTQVTVIWYVLEDSVLVFPARTPQPDDAGQPFYLKGSWVRAVVASDTGYVFSGYLSAMEPFKPAPRTDQVVLPSIETWILQQATLLDKRMQPNDDDDYTAVYSNHVVTRYHTGEGGGSIRYIFPRDRCFNDGFLLLNYFSGLEFTRKELEACEWRSVKEGPNYLKFESIGLEGRIYWSFLIYHDGEMLVVEEGGGC